MTRKVEVEQLITPQRMLALVKPFGISFEDAEVPSLEWQDTRQGRDDNLRVADKIFAEQYGTFTEAVRAATPDRTESQSRVLWTAENGLGSLAIEVRRDERVNADRDEFASWMSGPFHSVTIEGPANLEPVEGFVTKGATQRISFAASQHRLDTHSADSGRSIKTEFKLALPKNPTLEVREVGSEDAAPLFIAQVQPRSLKAEGTIKGSDRLLTATALAVKILERLDVTESKIKIGK